MDTIANDLARHAADKCSRALRDAASLAACELDAAQIALFVLGAMLGASAGALAAASGGSDSPEDIKTYSVAVLDIMRALVTKGAEAARAEMLAGLTASRAGS